MKKINTNSKYIFLLFVIFLQINIHSCSDNPVMNNPPLFDTVETYTWKADTIRQYYLTSFDVVDTSNIYFTANPTSSILHYDGKNYNPIDLNDPLFRGVIIKAWNNNNIYIGGSRIGGSWSPAVLKIIRNGVVYSYDVPDDSTVTIQSIYLVDENRAWLGCSENNIVYFFENGNFIKYQVGENERDNTFLNSQNNNLYLFSLKYVYLGINNYETILFVRKFINNNFIITNIDSSFSSSGKLRNFRNCTNGEIIFNGINSIYSFDNENIISIYSSSLINFGTVIGGETKNNLIIEKSHELDFPERKAYVWNGAKIMIERNLNFDYYTDATYIQSFKDKVYISTASGFSLPSTFIIGTKK